MPNIYVLKYKQKGKSFEVENMFRIYLNRTRRNLFSKMMDVFIQTLELIILITN